MSMDGYVRHEPQDGSAVAGAAGAQTVSRGRYRLMGVVDSDPGCASTSRSRSMSTGTNAERFSYRTPCSGSCLRWRIPRVASPRLSIAGSIVTMNLAPSVLRCHGEHRCTSMPDRMPHAVGGAIPVARDGTPWRRLLILESAKAKRGHQRAVHLTTKSPDDLSRRRRRARGISPISAW